MKKFMALLLCMITLFCALTITSSAATTKLYPDSDGKDILDYYQMAVGNEYVVYGRGTVCSNSDVSFLSMVIGGNVSNTYKKAVYSDVYYESSSYTRYHTLTTINSSSSSTISGLSKSRGTGTNESTTESYVEKVVTYTSSTRPNIIVNATLEAYKSSTDRFISYPNIETPC